MLETLLPTRHRKKKCSWHGFWKAGKIIDDLFLAALLFWLSGFRKNSFKWKRINQWHSFYGSFPFLCPILFRHLRNRVCISTLIKAYLNIFFIIACRRLVKISQQVNSVTENLWCSDIWSDFSKYTVLKYFSTNLICGTWIRVSLYV